MWFKKQKHKKLVWKTEKQVHNYESGTALITSTDKISQKVPLNPPWHQAHRKSLVWWDVVDPYFDAKPTIIPILEYFNTFVRTHTTSGQSTTQLFPTPTTAIFGQTIHSIELIDVKVSQIEIDVIVGFEIVEVDYE